MAEISSVKKTDRCEVSVAVILVSLQTCKINYGTETQVSIIPDLLQLKFALQKFVLKGALSWVLTVF